MSVIYLLALIAVSILAFDSWIDYKFKKELTESIRRSRQNLQIIKEKEQKESKDGV